MTPKVPISETGTATLGINVVRMFRRNRNTTRITSADRDDQRPLHVAHRGADGNGLIHGDLHVDARRGSRLAAAATVARMLSTVSMMFAPGWRKTMTSTAGLPLA